jgi:ubiquinone/menaquinone biosynthesis C-methylase UbiE
MKQEQQARSGREVWDRVWKSHRHSDAEPHEALLAALERTVGLPKGRKVLEVGADSAGDSLALAQGGGFCVALDFSLSALRVTSVFSRRADQPLALVRADALELPFPDASFDIVFSQGLIEHFSEPNELIREQLRVLKPGGVLLVDVPQRWNVYTVWKYYLMMRGKWFAGWETEFSLRDLERMIGECDGRVIGSYGWGYFPSLLFGIRNAHTYDVRHRTRWRIPGTVRAAIEGIWSSLERRREYYQFMQSIGVLATK